MSPVHKAQALREAIEHLLDAKALVFVALGDSDVGKETRDCIQELVDDLRADVLELTN